MEEFLSTFEIRFKTSSLKRFIVRDESADPEKSHSCVVVGLYYWGTSHNAPFLTLISFTLHVQMTLLSLTCVSLSQQVSLSWCYPQSAQADESDSARGFFLLKGSFHCPQSPYACSGHGNFKDFDFIGIQSDYNGLYI